MLRTFAHLAVRMALSLALIGFVAPSQAAVLLSEYIEGSSNNKAMELVNTGDTAVDLSGWSLQLFFNGSTSAGGTVALSGSIAPGEVYVVANSSAVFAASADLASGSLTFNGDDAVTLRDASSVVVDSFGQIGLDPGTEWGTGLTSTQDNTLRRLAGVSSGDIVTNDAFDPALQWSGFATDTFDGLGCAGESACETDPGPVEVTRIYDIQGAAHLSALAGQVVTTRGIVTALRTTSGAGFYLQDPDGDANEATSDGIFVFTNAAPTVSVGAEVLVTGTVTEYRAGGSSSANLTLTELGGTITIATPGDTLFINTSVTPTLLGAGGRAIPTTVIDDDTSGSVEVAAETTYDPASDGIDFYESMEGMLVQVNDAVSVARTNEFGEIWVVADGGTNATGMNARGGITLLPLGGTAADYNPERIQLDDVLYGSTNPLLDTGASAGSVTGVLHYDFGQFELLPLVQPAFIAGALEQEVAEVDGGVDRLRISNYNVENLDPNDTDANSGASGCPDTDVADGKFDAIAAQIVGNLDSPDIVALQEVQDSSGCADDGVVSSAATLATLVTAIENAGGPSYAAFDISPVDGADGGMPGGNIRVGYLYNAERVQLVEGTQGTGGSTDATAPVLDETGALNLTLSPGRVDPTNTAWDASRKPLAAVWQFGDTRIVTLNNHFASKGGSTSLYGRYQPAVNGSEEQRQAQAEVLNAFVDSVLTVDPDARVIALGDFNEFSFEEPMIALRGGDTPVLTDLVDAQLPEEERYTYSFDGNAQTLDHLLVSDSLMAAGPQVDPVHINSEFAVQTSDHDPVVASFNLPLTPCDSDVLAFSTRRPLVNEGQQSAAVTLTRSGTACGAVSVLLSTSGGTAAAGSDYLPLATTLSWGVGDTAAKTVYLSVVDDSVKENSETVGLLLSQPSRASIAQDSAVLTIRDNDRR